MHLLLPPDSALAGVTQKEFAASASHPDVGETTFFLNTFRIRVID